SHAAGDLAAEDLRKPVARFDPRGIIRHQLALIVEAKMNFGMRQGGVVHHVTNVAQLGRGRFQKFPPRGDVEEEIAHLYSCARRAASGDRSAGAAAVDGDAKTAVALAGARRYLDLRDRADARQRLAAKSQGRDLPEIGFVFYLARGVALDGERQIVARDAFAVVAHADQRDAGALNPDGYLFRARIECILHELLDDGRGPLDHLAGSDARGPAGGQADDLHRREDTAGFSARSRKFARIKKKGNAGERLCPWLFRIGVSLAAVVTAAEEDMPPFLFGRVEHFLARFGDLGEVLHPFVRAARVDDRARVEALLARMDDRIERTAPAAPDDLDVLHRVRAARHRPHDIVVVAGIYVLVHDDDIAAEIGARVALRGDQGGLARVAGIALLDRHDEHETAAARHREPHALNVRHAGFFQLVPDERRAQVRAVPTQL